MDFKEKKGHAENLIFNLKLNLTPEDKIQLKKLIDSYFRKRTNITNSGIENIAGGLLWIYSRINFLFQYDEKWSQQSIAAKLGIKPKTVSNIASKMMDTLKIDYFDERFARKDVAEKDPRNDFIMTKSGFILHKDYVKEMIINGVVTEEPTESLVKYDNEDGKSKFDEQKMNNVVKKEISDDKNNPPKYKKLSEFFK